MFFKARGSNAFKIGKVSLRSNNARVSVMIACCNSGLFASPSGYPKEYGTDNARGGFTLFDILSSSVIDTVDIPDASITR